MGWFKFKLGRTKEEELIEQYKKELEKQRLLHKPEPENKQAQATDIINNGYESNENGASASPNSYIPLQDKVCITSNKEQAIDNNKPEVISIAPAQQNITNPNQELIVTPKRTDNPITFRVNKEVSKYIKSKPNYSLYIKKLIAEDMKKNNSDSVST